MKRHLKKKQNGPLHDTQGFNAAELQAVKDSVQEVNDCSAYAQIQSKPNQDVQFLFIDEPFRTRKYLIPLVFLWSV